MTDRVSSADRAGFRVGLSDCQECGSIDPELWRRRAGTHRTLVGLAGGLPASDRRSAVVFSIDDCAEGGLPARFEAGRYAARPVPWYRTFFGRGSVTRPTGIGRRGSGP